MINIFFIKNISSLFFLLFVQVLIFNQIVFFGKYSPLVYVILIYTYPISKKKQYEFLILSFLLGFFIDLCSLTGGIHSSATLLVSFLRSFIIKGIINQKLEFCENLIHKISWVKKIFLLISIVLIHHSWIFIVEFFQWKSTLLIITHIFYNSLITIIFSILWMILFNLKN